MIFFWKKRKIDSKSRKNNSKVKKTRQMTNVWYGGPQAHRLRIDESHLGTL